MKGLKRSQAGFSTYSAIVAVAAITLLAATSWLVYQHNETKTVEAAANTQTSQQTITPAAPAPTVAYLHIKEWKVKLPLPASIKDAYYTMAGSNKGVDGIPNTAWLGLTSLNNKGCDVSGGGPSQTAAPIGSIIRVLPTDTDPVSGELYTKLYPNGVTIDGHYYAFKIWNNNTCAPSSTLQSLDSSFAGAANGSAIDTASN